MHSGGLSSSIVEDSIQEMPEYLSESRSDSSIADDVPDERGSDSHEASIIDEESPAASAWVQSRVSSEMAEASGLWEAEELAPQHATRSSVGTQLVASALHSAAAGQSNRGSSLSLSTPPALHPFPKLSSWAHVGW